MVICVSGKMQFELSKERQARKKKARTWTEAAKLALELYPKTPMGHKDIFNVIRAKGLKDVSGPASLACLNAMLHVHSRGPEAMFYRVDGCTSVFGLASNIPDGGVKMEIDEDDSGQEYDPGDSDQDSGTSVSPCGRKKDRVLYVRLPPGYKNTPLSLNNSSNVCNYQTEDSLLHKNEQLTVKPLAYKNEYYTRVRRMNGENLPDESKKEKCNLASAANLPVSSPSKVSQSHSQRAIKHALRQQQKRRRRNTAIAASGSAPPPIPRIIMKSLPPAPAGAGCVPEERWRCSFEKTSLRESTRHKPQTMRELLASIPGLSFKPRKRSNRKLSTAAQIAQTKKGCINIETPDSILVNTNLRALLNKHTFASLPPVYQYRLVQLLPQADRIIGPDYSVRLSATALNNEFFARACQEWKKRLQDGEFTPENQMKLKGEAERDHGKLDPWKIDNFEPVWGHTSLSDIADQSKSTPFSLNSQLKPSLNNQNKHVPTIKIKPVVRKSRLSSTISKHRNSPHHDSPSHSDENHLSVDSPLYNETSDMDTSMPGDIHDDLFGPPNKKLKGPEPCASVSSVVPISLSITVVQTTAPSQSIVPPITIRSVSVIRSNSGKKNSGRNDGVNLERSYQICKAALESTEKEDVTCEKVSPEPTVLQADDHPSPMVTSPVASLESSVSDAQMEEESCENQVPELSSPVTEADTPESPSSQFLLTTCVPSASPTSTLAPDSPPINTLETPNPCLQNDVEVPEVLSDDTVKDGSPAPEADLDSGNADQLPESMDVKEAETLSNMSSTDQLVSVSPTPSPLLSAETEDPVSCRESTKSPESNSLTMAETVSETDCLPVKEDTTPEENCVETADLADNPVMAEPAESCDSKKDAAENNASADNFVLQNDLSLASECLDSDSSSMQQQPFNAFESSSNEQQFNNSQVVDEDSTIILSLPPSEEEAANPDTSVVLAEESLPEKELKIDDTDDDNKLSVAEDSNISGDSSEFSAAEAKEMVCEDVGNSKESLEEDNQSKNDLSQPISDTQSLSPKCSNDETFSETDATDKPAELPRPLSAPSNLPPVHTNPIAEVSSLKRPASVQSYYRRAKVTPIVYIDSPESDDTRSESDKIECIPTPSPQSSDNASVSCSSESLPMTSRSPNDKDSSSDKSSRSGNRSVASSGDRTLDCNKNVSSPLQVSASPNIIAVSRSASTPSASSLTCIPLVAHRPSSNPDFESGATPQTRLPEHPQATNPVSLPEGCTGGTGGSLPSQAVSVVPATTQLPIASGGIMFPSANGLSNIVGTPAGDTPPRSLLQSSPVINGASSGIEGAITHSLGDSGGGNGSSGNNGNNCACNLKAMVMCLKCGAFCHDDCIGPSRLCVTCLIR
ncbi:polycomb protein Asx-like [Uloborus diversus]|uniref:polycomb protein Asx-like n=1 Tax=Uloborus diversus TaxID=327109 RepID=UPI002409A11D|nr:polycomb protein Asx-like [Uloborus diversus]